MLDSNYKKIFTIYIPLFITSVILWPKLPTQDNSSYFNFAGERSHNVFSNFPFLIIGILGIYTFGKKNFKNNFRVSGYIFSIGVVVTAFGSGYFHYNPDPATLFWDRLAMAISFSGMLGMITTDRIIPQLKTGFVYMILFLSVLSVINWSFGNHDLRPYLILQFVGGFYVLLAAVCTPSNILQNKKIYLSLFFYVLAKFFELYDQQILDLVNVTNGHSLKHLSAAVSAFLLLP